jgi:hypothetical protein
VTFYKALTAAGRGPFSAFDWRAHGDDWVEVADFERCGHGVHACRAADLPYWLDSEIWQVEFKGPWTTVGHKVVGQQARLVTQVKAWDPATADLYKLACLERSAGYAARECAGIDDAAAGQLADAIAALTTAAGPDDTLLAVLRDGVDRLHTAVARTGRWRGERLCGYVSEVAAQFEAWPPAALGYVAARVAQATSAAARVDHGTERALQARWLEERLGLDRA